MIFKILCITTMSLFLCACDKNQKNNAGNSESPSSGFVLSDEQLEKEIKNLTNNKDCESFIRVRDHYRYSPKSEGSDDNSNQEVKWSRYVADNMILDCASDGAYTVANELLLENKNPQLVGSDSKKSEILLEAMHYFIIAQTRSADDLRKSSMQEYINEVNYELWKLRKNNTIRSPKK